MKTIIYNFTILTIALLFSQIGSINAKSTIWNGSVSSSFSNSGNWSNGIPDSLDFITFNSNAPNNLILTQNQKITNLTINGDTLDLGGFTFEITGTAYFNGGLVTNGVLKPTGSLCHFGGATLDARIEATCGYFHMNSGVYKKPVFLTSTGAATSSSTYGNHFEDSLTITSNGAVYFNMGSSGEDIYDGPVILYNYSSKEIRLAATDTSYFNNHVTVNASSGGVEFGASGGVSILASAKTISVGTFSSSYLTLTKFIQLGSSAQTLTLSGTGVVSLESCIFNGNLTINAPGILTKSSTYHGNTTFNRTGSATNFHSYGSNVYAGNVTWDNAGSGGRVRLSSTAPDTYLADATFSSSGGQDLQVAYVGDNAFSGNITINSNKVVFNTSTGKVTFTGTNNQTLNGSYNYPFKKLAINKASGTVTSNTTLSVDDSLIFIQGNLITTSTNLLTMKHGSTANGASNNSFVSGPVKKVGNAAFEYPIGKEESYLPLTISAPATTSSEFVAEYKIDSLGVNTGAKDTTLGYVFRDRYWTLNRTSGSSSVYVTLTWDGNYKLLDSIATTCYWDGSKWANLGQGTYSSTDSSGSMRTSNTVGSFSEFTFAYKSIATIPSAPFSCLDIQTQGQLQYCLLTGAALCRITTDIDLEVTGPTGFLFLPIPVSSGTVLEGYSNSASASPKWWEADCPVLSTSHTTQYNPNFLKSMFMFTLEPGATIQNLRLRGASCNFQDYNGDQKLCGGIFVGDDWGTSQALIANCEISCFSYAGFFKSVRPRDVALENCYVHKVKANGNATGLGYGCWAQGKFLNPNDDGNITYDNVIFDDCKAAIDGQGYPNNWNINKCSFTQFFLSEDINMHNVNHEILNSPALNFSCYTAPTSCLGNIFYGPKCTTSDVCSTQVICSGYPSKPPPNGWQTDGQQIHIYDNGGANTTIENSIFHNYILKDKKGANISLNYPLRNHPLGNTSYSINILNNTFSTPFYDPNDIFTYNNNGGYARVADNYIEACVWGTTFNRSGNSFSYKPGLTAVTQPCEVYLNLIESGNTNTLPMTLNRSATPDRSFTQWIDHSTDFRLSLSPGSLGSSTLSYIIRPNPNQDIATQVNMVKSNENYFYHGEIITDQNLVTIPGYDKPGLYGIDVLGFDTQTGEEFKTSAWQHIPLIVKPLDTDNNILYFNIKDSFKEFLGVSSTGVFKQVEFNGFPIWREDIAVGGDGWEYVEVDLNGNILDTTTPESILSKINLDGTKNTITFSIYMGPDPVSTSTVRGVLVWVDDIYIKKHSHPFGENLILDGSVENSSNADFKATPSEKCSWYSEAAVAMSNCDPLRITTGANGEVKNDPTLRYVDGEPVFSSGTGTFYPDAGISNTERKSGNNAIALILPAFENEAGCFDYPVDPNTSVIGASTDIDFTDMFPCSSYLSSPLNFTSLPCTTISQVFDNGERFLITTDYTLCGNLTLKGCQIALEPDVKIIIPNGKTLTIDNEGTLNSHLFACDEMWKGIIVETGGNLIIDGNKNNDKIGTLIEHAEIAVTNQNAASMKISFTTFNHNKTAIEMIPGTYNTANNFLYGTHFLCSNWQMTKGPLEGQFPDQHVLMNGVTGDMQIGSTANPSSAYTNKFSNALYGIGLNESNLKLANTDFEDIYNRDMDAHVFDHGSAIQISNQATASFDVTIGDADEDFINTFKNVNRGVTFKNYMSNGNVKIFNCEFDNSEYNFRNSGGEFQNTAITIQSPNVVTGRTTEVFGNGITDFRIGIHAINIENMIVYGYDAMDDALPNTISYHLGNGLDVTRKHTGIWLQTCANASIKENVITNDEPITENPDLIRGIAADNSTDLTICGNQITNLGYAMQFEGDCLNSQLKNNIMNTYEIGINYVLGQFSPQGASGASWANEWSHLDQAKLKVDGTLNQPGAFIWYHQGSASNTGNTFRLAPSSSAVVFPDDDENNLPSIICKDELIAGGGIDRDANYGPVVADTITYPIFQDEARYLARSALFKRLSDYPALLTISSPLDSVFQAFYDSTLTGSIGKLDSVSRSIGLSDFSAAADANAAVDDENSMEANTKLINHLLIHKVALDSVLSSSDTTSLEYIFNQHWIDGGLSVYTAAPLLFKEYYTSSISLRTTSSAIEPIAQPTPAPVPELGIYPNPTGEMINFTRNLPSGAVVKVFDTSGREMLHEVNPTQINVSSLENGYYILKIFENHELIFHKNIVIIKSQ